MTRTAALFWIPLGFAVSVFDGWLSMLSLLGVMNPSNPLGYVFAAAVGIGLTLFAVLFPVMRGPNTTTVLIAAWIVLAIFDVATSILGGVWYGIMRMPLSSTIDIFEMSYNPANSGETILFIGVVLGAAYSCHKLGEAMNSLMR